MLPNKGELGFRDLLVKNRDLPGEVLDLLRRLLRGLRPIDILRLSIDYLGALDRDATSKGVNDRGKALSIIVKAPTIVVTYYRLNHDGAVPRPRSDLGHVANYYYMFFGKEPSGTELRALETMFITYMEHGMNNSSFTAADPRLTYLRVVAGDLAREKGGDYVRLYETALALEKAVEKHLGNKGVYANTDLYASLIFYSLGFPPEYNPANFALANG